MKKLSIILPVYNVEPYIRACMKSVFHQGLDENDYEVIVVNDGTEDNSMEMIADFRKLHSNITVIEQENQGLSVARNNGIAKAKGEYILMIDSDDLLINNSLPIPLKKALETKADIIVADYVNVADGEILKLQDYEQQEFTMTEKTGEKLFLEDLNPHECYVWHTLYRRMFLIDNKITFYPGVVYQDVPFTHECYLKAKRCFITPWPIYIYRKDRAGAATTTFNKKKALDYCVVIAKTWELTKLGNMPTNIYRKLAEDVYASFYSLVYSSIYTFKDKTEVVNILRHLKQLVPDLKFTNNIKQRVVTFLFMKMPRLYVSILTAKSI